MDPVNRHCPKCNSPMEDGFLLYSTAGTNVQVKWIEGEPESSIWSGIRTRGHTIYPVTTYRCVGCGYLESYTVGASETLLRAAEGAGHEPENDLLRASEGQEPDE